MTCDIKVIIITFEILNAKTDQLNDDNRTMHTVKC